MKCSKRRLIEFSEAEISLLFVSMEPSKQRDMSRNSSSGFCQEHEYRSCLHIFFALFLVYIFLIPLFIFVLYLGYHRRKKLRSGSRSETSSHSDVFTYNMTAMELGSYTGACLFLHGVFACKITYLSLGLFIFSTVSPGPNLFHVLTCVDRYLAVVHPVTYMKLRQSGWVRIRNIIIGSVWLICFGSVNLIDFISVWIIFNVIILIVSCAVIGFCSLSVLCVLTRPGPGDTGGKRVHTDQTKKRAFHTITIIMLSLSTRFLGTLLYLISLGSSKISLSEHCIIIWSLAWFAIPSSLVLPLLFLHRAGKLSLCKTKQQRGTER